MVAAGAIGLSIAVVMGAMFAGQDSGSRLDALVAAAVTLPPGSAPIRYPVSVAVQGLADPLPGTGIVAVLALVCWWRGCRRLAVVAVTAPAITDLTVIAAKHVVGRTIHGGSLSYPSTHAAHSVVVAMVLALLLTTLLDRGPRVTVAVLLGAAVVAAAVMGWALVAGDVHYATDVFGGLGVALAALPALAFGVDRFGGQMPG